MAAFLDKHFAKQAPAPCSAFLVQPPLAVLLLLPL